jgi:hypothetical protein
MDLGSVHERSAAIFTVALAQYAPAAAPGEEDRVLVSRLQASRAGPPPRLHRARPPRHAPIP